VSARAQQLYAQLRHTIWGAGDWEQDEILERVAELLVDELGWIPPEALETLEQERTELAAAVDRVRRLHDQDDSILARGAWCPADGQPEPCKTIRALNGRPPRPTSP
jgi:hypothetical protein